MESPHRNIPDDIEYKTSIPTIVLLFEAFTSTSKAIFSFLYHFSFGYFVWLYYLGMCIPEAFLNVQRAKLNDPTGFQYARRELYSERYKFISYGLVFFWPFFMIWSSIACMVFTVAAFSGSACGVFFAGGMVSILASWILSTLSHVHDCFEDSRIKKSKKT